MYKAFTITLLVLFISHYCFAQDQFSKFEVKLDGINELNAIPVSGGIPKLLINFRNSSYYGLTLNDEWQPTKGKVLNIPYKKPFIRYRAGSCIGNDCKLIFSDVSFKNFGLVQVNFVTGAITTQQFSTGLDKREKTFVHFSKDSKYYVLAYNRSSNSFRLIAIDLEGQTTTILFKLDPNQKKLVEYNFDKNDEEPVKYDLVNPSQPYDVDMAYRNSKVFLLEHAMAIELKKTGKNQMGFLELSFDGSVGLNQYTYPNIHSSYSYHVNHASFIYNNLLCLGSASGDTVRIDVRNYPQGGVISNYQFDRSYYEQNPEIRFFAQTYLKREKTNRMLASPIEFRKGNQFLKRMDHGDFFLQINNIKKEPQTLLYGAMYSFFGYDPYRIVPTTLFSEHPLNFINSNIALDGSNIYELIKFRAIGQLKKYTYFFHGSHVYMIYYQASNFYVHRMER